MKNSERAAEKQNGKEKTRMTSEEYQCWLCNHLMEIGHRDTLDNDVDALVEEMQGWHKGDINSALADLAAIGMNIAYFEKLDEEAAAVRERLGMTDYEEWEW